MSEIIFQLNESVGLDGKQYMSIVLVEPPGSVVVRPFPCNSDEPEFQELIKGPLNADTVKRAGARLFEALNANPNIGPHLQTALQTVAGSRMPIFVEIATPAGAEALPWEAMCTPQGDYLGLDERWSLARMVKPPTAAPGYTLTPPIRIAAVLSCLGISARGEVDALKAAVSAVGPGEVKLMVVVSEDELYESLRHDIATGVEKQVTCVELMPTDLSELQNKISDFGPHLLHFFCHGSLDGSPHIALAIKEDWITLTFSSITVEAGQFGGFTQPTHAVPWLVVLNCCEGAGANPAAGSQSLAWSLVFKGFAPAVVGMREPMVDTTANAVTRALYTKLLTDLSKRIAAADQSAQPVDWPRLVVAARDKLARVPGLVKSLAAASTKEWTLPVIYVRPEGFKLQVLPRPRSVRGGLTPVGGPDPAKVKEEARAKRLEIQALQEILAAMPPRQAPELRAEAENRIADLSKDLNIELD